MCTNVRTICSNARKFVPNTEHFANLNSIVSALKFKTLLNIYFRMFSKKVKIKLKFGKEMYLFYIIEKSMF